MSKRFASCSKLRRARAILIALPANFGSFADVGVVVVVVVFGLVFVVVAVVDGVIAVTVTSNEIKSARSGRPKTLPEPTTTTKRME